MAAPCSIARVGYDCPNRDNKHKAGMMEQKDLKGRVAIVTGSSSGIGASVALGLARCGADVVINYSKSAKEAEEVADAVRQTGVQVQAVQANVGSDADCRKLAASAMDAFGRIDIRVNNAGITKFAGHRDLDALNAEDFTNIYSVNVIGAFQMIRACVEGLRAHGDGAVVNVSSIAGIEGIGSSVAYAASKGALNTMTLSLARALAPEIRVNAICPGFMDTRWFSDAYDKETAQRLRDNIKNTTPLQVVSTAEDVADAPLVLISDAARRITGETLLVDAGQHLGSAPLRAR